MKSNTSGQQSLPLDTPAFVVAEAPGTYYASRVVTESDILKAAQTVLASKFAQKTPIADLTSVRDYLSVTLAPREAETFCVIFLDNRNCVLAFEEMFQGTLNGCAVYPREIVKRAVIHNAGGVILVHNHPSGQAVPSAADEILTQRLKEALSLIDVRVLDHLVVGGTTITSFADSGLL